MAGGQADCKDRFGRVQGEGEEVGRQRECADCVQHVDVEGESGGEVAAYYDMLS
jgi:hypothetical protein